MEQLKSLHELLDDSAGLQPNQPAVEESGCGSLNYGELAALTDQLRDRLHNMGVSRGDRVGIYMRKSIEAVASIFGVLKIGAAYVPVDPNAPVSRNAYILSDCSVKTVVLEKRYAEQLRLQMKNHDANPQFLIIEDVGGGEGLKKALAREQAENPVSQAKTAICASDDLAYILYTSGSTGKPKGVMLSHKNAVSFVDWCSETFQPNSNDRFSSHAPFHFDLSILDLYVSIKHGATLVLIDDAIGKSPAQLASLIAEKHISIWYSTPSILSMLVQYGKMELHDYSDLRIVLFAGEVFPVKHLRALTEILPAPKYVNLYGPTETNVCTFYKIPADIPYDRTQPFPIGKTCSHFRSRVVDEHGKDVAVGEEGELCICGDGVMQGYWNLQEMTSKVFLTDEYGDRWYKTGDIVIEQDGDYLYVGRRDRMVKKRGYRVELGEIEAGLYRHPAIKEAAVIALSDAENGVRIKAFISCHDGMHPSVIEMKGFCTKHLPSYMVPDLLSYQETLPKTSTDKIDYQKLKTME